MAHLYNLPDVEMEEIDPSPPTMQPERRASRRLNTPLVQNKNPYSRYGNDRSGEYQKRSPNPSNNQRSGKFNKVAVQRAAEEIRFQQAERNRMQIQQEKKLQSPMKQETRKPPAQKQHVSPPVNRATVKAFTKDQSNKTSAEKRPEMAKEKDDECYVGDRQPVSTEALIKRMEEGDWEKDKTPFLGFNEDAPKDRSILDKIECDSAVLFKILNENAIGDTIQIVAGLSSVSRGGSIRVPEKLWEVLGGATPQLQVTKVPGVDKTILELYADLRKPFEAGWKRELIYNCVSDTRAEKVQYVSPDGTELKTMDDLIDYLENIYGMSEAEGGLTDKNFAFCRASLTLFEENGGELLYINDPRSGGKRLVKVRRMKFPKSRIPSHETASRVATGQFVKPKRTMKGNPNLPNVQGRVLSQGVNSRKQQSIGKASVENEDPFRKRQVRAPRLPMNSRSMGGLNENEECSGMFQISALHEANPMLVSGLEGEREKYRMEQDRYQEQQQASQPGRNSQRRKGELFPCSIRCVGMAGEVPNLQCTRCLCLYHADCLGISTNFGFANFVCENCVSPGGATDKALESSARKAGLRATNSSISRAQVEGGLMRNQIANSMLAPRKIGHTVISPEFQPIGRGGMSIRRMDMKPSDLGLSPMKDDTRIRGRLGQPASGRFPGKQAYPQLPNLQSGGKSVTITPLPSLGRGGRLPIPNLIPILGNNSNPCPMPVILPRPNLNLRGMSPRGGLARGVNARIPLPMPDLIKYGEKNAVKDKNIIQRGISVAPLDELFEVLGSDSPFRQYPESVVSIGEKRYIATPIVQREEKRSADSDISLQLAQAETDQFESNPKKAKLSESEKKDETGSISSNESALKRIFQYLSVPDLLTASCVNSTWNKVASRKELWQTVRMKNARVCEFDGFVKFLNKHETETIDLRKMMNESGTNWELLVQSLGKVSTLKSIVLGSRCSSPRHLELLGQYCPNIEITQK